MLAELAAHQPEVLRCEQLLRPTLLNILLLHPSSEDTFDAPESRHKTWRSRVLPIVHHSRPEYERNCLQEKASTELTVAPKSLNAALPFELLFTVLAQNAPKR